MLSRLSAAILICLALTGCILQSKAPLFSDADGEMILAGMGTDFTPYSFSNGQWTKEDDIIRFTPAGGHYVATDGKSSIDITFSKLSGGFYVLQAVEKDKPTVYGLVELGKGEIVFHPLTCTALRETGSFASYVTFKDDDCMVKDDADTGAMFAAMAADPVPSPSKLVAIP